MTSSGFASSAMCRRGYAPAFALALAVHGLAFASLWWLPATSLPMQPPAVLSVRWMAEDANPPTKTPMPQVLPRPLPAKIVPRQRLPRPVDPKPLEPATEKAVPSEVQSTAPPAATIASAASGDMEASPGAHSGPVSVPELPVSAPRFDADYLSNPAPDYPAASRAMGEQGRVLLRVLVSAAGDAVEVHLRTSSGFDRLDSAAMEAVRRWRFLPARQGEQAVSASVIVPIVFSLRR